MVLYVHPPGIVESPVSAIGFITPVLIGGWIQLHSSMIAVVSVLLLLPLVPIVILPV